VKGTRATDVANPQEAEPSLAGQTLGERYRLLSLLGSGSMGDVYLAEHVVLKKKLAVKVLKTNIGHHEELAQRFQQEAVAASSIGHENIINVQDFGRTAEGALYFVMELLDGESLRTLVPKFGGLPLARGLPILLQVCRALAAAHARGIVHRDLKADNVMVVPREDGSDLVKVLDFGISKVSRAEDPEGARITQQGVVLGTPAYMAPEQIRGESTDLRADVYAFGVLAFEVATAYVPFEAQNITGVMMKHLTEQPRPPSAMRPDLMLPAVFDALVLRAMEKEPGLRFQNMGEVREALAKCFEAIGQGPTFTPPIGTAIQRPTPEPADANAAFAATRHSGTDPALSGAVAELKVRDAQREAQRKAILLAGVVTAAALAAIAGWAALKPPVPPPVVLQAPIEPPRPTQPPTPPPVVAAPEPPAVVAPEPVKPEPVKPEPPRPPPVQKELKDADIAQGFRQGLPTLRACIQDNRKLMPAATGTVKLSITIQGTGAVSAAEVMSPVPASVSTCLVARAKQLKFPRHKSPPLMVQLPFQYVLKD
jgi:eukaryotic-like serine/threonine-protein kinase